MEAKQPQGKQFFFFLNETSNCVAGKARTIFTLWQNMSVLWVEDSRQQEFSVLNYNTFLLNLSVSSEL